MRKYLLLGSLFFSVSLFAAEPVTVIPMDVDALARMKEQTSGNNLTVYGLHKTENLAGAVGDAFRFDGYSTYVEGNIPSYSPSGSSSFSMWVAPETYPIVALDLPSDEKITLAGTIDNDSKNGWAFTLSKTGKYAFETYTGGNSTKVEAKDLLPCYEWSYLVAVNDPVSETLSFYRNGEMVGRVKSYGPLNNEAQKITIGKTAGHINSPFLLKSFNGLIDDISVYDGLLSSNEINATPENPADLSIPESRFAKDLLRPKYHGMPGANWTNETHGMTYSDGKYHVFFQKNANGPFMNRLHWGHLTSDNLYDWTEEKIAIAPSEDYDIKGAWSGCVFTDNEITGGMPNIIYTGVDYAKAYIVQAAPVDDSLLEWEKKGVIINGRPDGLSDDFRDPYFFRNGDNAYIIVGTAKDGRGATTLHRYNPSNKTWSNDGSIFFTTDKTEYGTFWEMPNITKMADGKWLFTVTPQNTSNGVHTLYWIGDINDDGTFKPESQQPVDLELINGQGYGLLSPTIYQKDGKTLLMGIVPDKLPTEENCSLGWAHLYSFPREISLAEDGALIQKPYSGLADLRSADSFSEENITVDGTKNINGIGGRQYEVKGVFKVGDTPFGFNLFKNNKGKAVVSYTPSTNRLEVNLNNLNRKVNDNNSFNGRYAAILPEVPEKGSELSLNIFVDGSILDIFVNDKWATSVRVYPTDTDADGVEVFSESGPVQVTNLQGWLLGDSSFEDNGNGNNGQEEGEDGIEEIFQDKDQYVNVFNLNGILVRKNIKVSDLQTELPAGLYVVDNYKILIK